MSVLLRGAGGIKTCLKCSFSTRTPQQRTSSHLCPTMCSEWQPLTWSKCVFHLSPGAYLQWIMTEDAFPSLKALVPHTMWDEVIFFRHLSFWSVFLNSLHLARISRFNTQTNLNQVFYETMRRLHCSIFVFLMMKMSFSKLACLVQTVTK